MWRKLLFSVMVFVGYQAKASVFAYPNPYGGGAGLSLGGGTYNLLSYAPSALTVAPGSSGIGGTVGIDPIVQMQIYQQQVWLQQMQQQQQILLMQQQSLFYSRGMTGYVAPGYSSFSRADSYLRRNDPFGSSSSGSSYSSSYSSSTSSSSSRGTAFRGMDVPAPVLAAPNPKSSTQAPSVVERPSSGSGAAAPTSGSKPPDVVERPSTSDSGLEAKGAECTDCRREQQRQTQALTKLSVALKSSQLSNGAHRVLDVLYQRCDAHDIILKYRQGNNGANPYLKPAGSYPKQCNVNPETDILKFPPHFHVTGLTPTTALTSTIRSEVEKEDPNCKSTQYVDMFGKDTVKTSQGEKRTIANDCSGFVSASVLAAGLRLSPKKDGVPESKEQRKGSWEFYHAAAKPDTCFEMPKFSADRQLEAGDIVAYTRPQKKPGEMDGHVLMIDQVGEDPFALRDIRSLAECKTKLNPRKFNFTVAQSNRNGRDANVGAHRIHASEFCVVNMDLTNGLIELGIRACQAKFNGPTPAQFGSGVDRDLSGVRVVRHRGMNSSDRDPMAKACQIESGPACMRNQKCLTANCSTK